MIKYILKCNRNHEFESWFSNSEEFDKLNKRQLLECIYCSSKKISKSIMSPMISNLSNKKEKIKEIDKGVKEEKNKLQNQLQALTRENEVLKHQLRKYV